MEKNKILRNKFHKELQDLYTENYKTLLREIKDLYKQKHFLFIDQETSYYQESNSWTSLVVQWLRILLPMQGTQVRALVEEDPTCRGATKPMRHNYKPVL